MAALTEVRVTVGGIEMRVRSHFPVEPAPGDRIEYGGAVLEVVSRTWQPASRAMLFMQCRPVSPPNVDEMTARLHSMGFREGGTT